MRERRSRIYSKDGGKYDPLSCIPEKSIVEKYNTYIDTYISIMVASGAKVSDSNSKFHLGPVPFPAINTISGTKVSHCWDQKSHPVSWLGNIIHYKKYLHKVQFKNTRWWGCNVGESEGIKLYFRMHRLTTHCPRYHNFGLHESQISRGTHCFLFYLSDPGEFLRFAPRATLELRKHQHLQLYQNGKLQHPPPLCRPNLTHPTFASYYILMCVLQMMR